MKVLISLICIHLITSGFTQIYEKELSTKIIVESRSLIINGGLKSSTSSSAKSRVVIPVELPENTKEWYYSFSTTEGKSGVKTLSLAAQLSSLLLDQSGTTANIIEKLNVPEGTAMISAYLLDRNNFEAFINKVDLSGGTFKYYPDGSSMNTKQAVVKVNNTKRKFYIGLKNPSSLNAVNITIEVIAIVEKSIYIDEWTPDNINKIKSECINQFQTDTQGKTDVCSCLSDNIVTEYKPSEWSNLSTDSQNTIKKINLDNCYELTGTTALRVAEQKHQENLRKEQELFNSRISFVSNAIKSSIASKDFGDYKEAKEIAIEALDTVLLNKKIISHYGNQWIGDLCSQIALYCILENSTKESSIYIKKGLTFNPESKVLRSKLGLYHLILGNYKEAEKAFLYYKKNSKTANGTKFINIIKEDLENIEFLLTDKTNLNKIIALLKIKG